MERIALAKRWLAGVAALLLLALGFVGASPAHAASEWCTDGTPSSEREVVLTTYPVYLAAMVWPSGPTAVGVCYRTAPLSSGTAGGFVAVDAAPASSGYGATSRVGCWNDAGVQQPLNCGSTLSANSAPTYSVSGETITMNIPFAVCAGVCANSSPNIAKTGLVVGSLVNVAGPTGSSGAGYALSGLEVWLNGVLLLHTVNTPLGGAYVGSSGSPGVVLPSLSGSNPPCVVGGICMPTGQLGVTGGTETVTLLFPTGGTQSVPVTIPSRCIVNFSGPC